MTLDVDVTFHSIRMDGKKGGTTHSATLSFVVTNV